MPDELDSFLKEGAPEAAQTPVEAPAEQPAPSPPPAEPKPSEKPPKAPDEAPAKAPEPEPEEDLPVSGHDGRTVPVSALEKVRNDWKAKAAAAEAKAELLAKQLEEAKRPTPQYEPPPQPHMVQPPDFNTDPTGYIRHMEIRQQQQMLNDRLNLSEHMLREKLGDEKVNEYQQAFQEFAKQDPTLFPQLYQQRTPYQWLVGEIDRRRMHAEIGDDPAGYEARLRAKFEAEWAAKQPAAVAVSPAAGQPPSLASARTVAPRGSSAFTGPPPLDDILPSPERRRRQQR